MEDRPIPPLVPLLAGYVMRSARVQSVLIRLAKAAHSLHARRQA